MIKKIKLLIFNKFFKKEIEDIQSKLELKTFKSESDIRNIVRSRVKNLDSRILNTKDDILYKIGDFDSQTSFLGRIREVAMNKEFRELLDYLTRDQILFVAKDAENINQVLFGRGSINGLSLIEDEIDQMKILWEERKESKEDFDKYAVVGDE